MRPRSNSDTQWPKILKWQALYNVHVSNNAIAHCTYITPWHVLWIYLETWQSWGSCKKIPKAIFFGLSTWFCWLVCQVLQEILDNNKAWPIQGFNGLCKLGSATQQLHSNNDCKKKGNFEHLKNWRSVVLLCFDNKILSASLQHTVTIYEYLQRDRVSVSGKPTEIKDTNCLDNYRVWLSSIMWEVWLICTARSRLSDNCLLSNC